MILLNGAILGLIAYEIKNLAVKKMKKELAAYIVLAISAVILEILCIILNNNESLFTIIIDALRGNHQDGLK